jgi:hypothetical protein
MASTVLKVLLVLTDRLVLPDHKDRQVPLVLTVKTA